MKSSKAKPPRSPAFSETKKTSVFNCHQVVANEPPPKKKKKTAAALNFKACNQAKRSKNGTLSIKNVEHINENIIWNMNLYVGMLWDLEPF